MDSRTPRGIRFPTLSLTTIVGTPPEHARSYSILCPRRLLHDHLWISVTAVWLIMAWRLRKQALVS